MATTNDTSAGGGQPAPNEDKTREVFAAFQQALIDGDIALATEEKNRAEGNLDSARSTLETNLEAWNKAQEFLSEYTEIHRQISLPIAQSAVEFQGNVNTANAERGQVTAKLNQAIAAIKGLHKKLGLAKTTANTLEQVLDDACNKEAVKSIEQNLDIKGKVEALLDMMNEASAASSQSIDTAVKTAGTEASLNVQNMVSVAGVLKGLVDTFKNDVNGNLAYFKTKDEETRTGVDNAISAVIGKEDDLNAIETKLAAYNKVSDFSAPDAARQVSRSIDEIVDEAEKNYYSLLPEVDDDDDDTQGT